MDNWLTVGVKGTAIWPTVETSVRIENHALVLKPATRETEQSINMELEGVSRVDALTLINRFLSVLSWCDDNPLENCYGWSGNTRPVTVPREVRKVGSSIGFPFQRDLERNPKARLALALFREGRTVNSIPFAFLSYFKVLNMFWKDKYTNGKNPIIEGIRNTLPKLKDVRALGRLKVLQSSESDIPRYLYKSGRCAVAHAYMDPISDPDDASDIRRLSEDVQVIKAIAEFLITSEFQVSRSIAG